MTVGNAIADACVGNQVMFDTVNSTAVCSDLIESDPDENGTPDMVALAARLATLTALDAGQLFAFAMKLRPSNAGHTPLVRPVRRLEPSRW